MEINCPNCGAIKATDSVISMKGETKEKEYQLFSICPFCGEELKLRKTPKFCPYCRENLHD